MKYIVDGSAFLHIVARIEGRNFSYVNGEADSTLWPGWFVYLTRIIVAKMLFVHADSTGIPPTIVVVNVVRTPVYAYMIFLVTVGVVLSIVCLLFNIIFRNRK